jgi:hypothetical protein
MGWYDTLMQFLMPDQLPVIKVMPDKVKNLNLNMELLKLPMSQAHQINPAVHTGFVLPKAAIDSASGTSL